MNKKSSFDKVLDEVANELSKTTFGMNRMLDGVRNAMGTYDSYPPFNFVQVDENKYHAVFALAGFAKEELTIEVKENFLTVAGNKELVDDDDSIYMHRGIAYRSFKRFVQIAEDVVVNEATMENGLLTIVLEQVVPDEKKPITIDIK